MITMAFFIKRFNPQLIKRADFEPGDIKQFSPLSQEVQEASIHLVWTAIDADGRQLLVPGFHLVNRLYYVLCTEPWANENIEVAL